MSREVWQALAALWAMLGVVGLIAWGLYRAWKSAPTDYWITYQEQLEKDSRWWRCQEGPGCDWPEHCHPGDCRRPE